MKNTLLAALLFALPAAAASQEAAKERIPTDAERVQEIEAQIARNEESIAALARRPKEFLVAYSLVRLDREPGGLKRADIVAAVSGKIERLKDQWRMANGELKAVQAARSGLAAKLAGYGELLETLTTEKIELVKLEISEAVQEKAFYEAGGMPTEGELASLLERKISLLQETNRLLNMQRLWLKA